MATKKTRSIKSQVIRGIRYGLLIAVATPMFVFALTSYPPASLLQPEDVTSSHLRDGEILDADINAKAGIGYSKVGTSTVQGAILFTLNQGIGTTTGFNIATSTLRFGIGTSTPGTTLSVGGNAVIAATTTTGALVATSTLGLGTNIYAVPAAPTVAGQVLSSNLSNELSWVTAGGTAFGGNGSDGALDTSSAAVEIDLASTTPVVKNFTSINVATNNLTFKNATSTGSVVILKSQGACTISSTITANNVGGMGGEGGTGGTEDEAQGGYGGGGVGDTGSYPAQSGNATGGNGEPGEGVTVGFPFSTTTQRMGGLAGRADNQSGVIGSLFATGTPEAIIQNLTHWLIPGGGGGGGQDGSGSASGGRGGKGGGALYIECGGTLTFSGTIDVGGSAGQVVGAQAGDGGGGGGGIFVGLANTIGTDSGSITTAGGASGGGLSGPGGEGYSTGWNLNTYFK